MVLCIFYYQKKEKQYVNHPIFFLINYAPFSLDKNFKINIIQCALNYYTPSHTLSNIKINGIKPNDGPGK